MSEGARSARDGRCDCFKSELDGTRPIAVCHPWIDTTILRPGTVACHHAERMRSLRVGRCMC